MNELYDYITETVFVLPALVQVMILISLLFICLTIVIISLILISRFLDNYNIRRREVLKKEAIEHVLPYLFNEEEWGLNKFAQFKRKHLKNKFERKVFLNCLTKFQMNLKGKSAGRIQSLYAGLRLHEKSLKKLTSSSWNTKVKGIIELAEMDMKEYIPLVKQFINHRNPVLRSEAQIALIQLEKEQPFEFLNELKEPLHAWQQVELAHVSEEIDKSTLPDFSQWLKHKEDSIVIFSLRMIALHNQISASDRLVKMLHENNASPHVTGAVIFALGQLDIQETGPYLQWLYPHANIYIQHEILNTLSIFRGIEPELIFKDLMEKESQFFGLFYKDSTVFIPTDELLIA